MQRVAIARALAFEPDILLMDEAFNHLDAITARIMRFDLADILAMAKPTILFVTHDLSEAVFLADRIYMMKPSPARIFKEVVIDFPRASQARRPEVAWNRSWSRSFSACWRERDHDSRREDGRLAGGIGRRLAAALVDCSEADAGSGGAAGPSGHRCPAHDAGVKRAHEAAEMRLRGPALRVLAQLVLDSNGRRGVNLPDELHRE
jgi:hypothetical protein